MTRKRSLYLSVAAICLAGCFIWSQPRAETTVPIKKTDIGGVVTSPNGPEAGVWVIAETHDLPTRFAKMVVTDDQGRYVVPDLPKAKYTVWVRGYGLADSAKVEAEPGKQLNLKAVPAANAAEAAKVYPAIYWYSMLKIPGADQFGGHSDIPDKVKQTDWLNAMKNNGCIGCHQLGNLATRTLPKGLGEFKTSEEAWARRVQSGQAGPLMVNLIAGDLASTPIKYFAEWTDRIAEGELPKNKPQRPQGIERNVVITTWDWADDKHYLHDEISTDKRNPTVNGYGPLFGSPEYATDIIPILDPVKNSVTKFHAPVRDADMPFSLGPGPRRGAQAAGAVALLGQRADLGHPHQQPQFDDGRERPAVARRGGARRQGSGFLRQGLRPAVGKTVPARRRASGRLAMLDPKTMKYTFVDTCFTTHHLQFGFDKNNTLWTLERRRRRRGRLAQHQKIPGDRRRGEIARLDRAHRRYVRRRPARRLHRARQAARTGQGHAHRPGVLCGHAEPGRRHGVGHDPRQSRRDRAAQSRHQPAGDGAFRNLQCRGARLRPARRRYRQ